MSYRTDSDQIVIDAVYVNIRLNEAGASLLALPALGTVPAQYRVAWPEIVREASEAYGYTPEDIRPSPPSARRITEMDEVYFRWLPLVGEKSVQTRKLLWLRSFVHPISEKHLWSWRRIEGAMGINRDSLKIRHARGVDRIVTRLNRPSWVEPEANRLP